MGRALTKSICSRAGIASSSSICSAQEGEWTGGSTSISASFATFLQYSSVEDEVSVDLHKIIEDERDCPMLAREWGRPLGRGGRGG